VKLDRKKALLLSLAVTIVLNMLAGVLTIIYANGTTIVETNPLSSALLAEFGPSALLLHAILIALIYPFAYLISRIISSTYWLFRSKRILLFAFSLMIAFLPTGAFVDFMSDVLVVSAASNILVGSQKIVGVALVCSVPFALVQVKRRWTLDVPSRQASG
jgi:hypothetical protein